jgi:hypothetical protein
MTQQPIPSVRRNKAGANHHLWNNNGTWWLHLTFHLPGFVKHRLRTSLKTRDVLHARRLRDSLLALYGIHPNALQS